MVCKILLVGLEVSLVDWIKPHSSGSMIKLYILPGASVSCLSGLHGERLKIKIKAPPRDGEASEELIEFLAGILKMNKSGIHLLRGESSRNKDLLIELPPDKVINLLI